MLPALIVLNDCAKEVYRKVPMKPCSTIGIPDGEYLHYVNYTGGEKISDEYAVTRIISNSSEAVLYKIYIKNISVTLSNREPGNYTDWPTRFLIDPRSGSVLEGDQYFATNKQEMQSMQKYGMGNLLYEHYKLESDKGRVEFNTRSVLNSRTNESRVYVKIKPGFPVWEGEAFMFYSLRFLDFRKGGIVYAAAPEYMKEPMPNTYTIQSKETIQTANGSYKTVRLGWSEADPFIDKLLGPIIKNIGYWLEDSDRKLVVKVKAPSGDGTYTELAEVSNVR